MYSCDLIRVDTELSGESQFGSVFSVGDESALIAKFGGDAVQRWR
jgi:hypothetical protein